MTGVSYRLRGSIAGCIEILGSELPKTRRSFILYYSGWCEAPSNFAMIASA